MAELVVVRSVINGAIRFKHPGIYLLNGLCVRINFKYIFFVFTSHSQSSDYGRFFVLRDKLSYWVPYGLCMLRSNICTFVQLS